jgi:hypothetical protein
VIFFASEPDGRALEARPPSAIWEVCRGISGCLFIVTIQVVCQIATLGLKHTPQSPLSPLLYLLDPPLRAAFLVRKVIEPGLSDDCAFVVSQPKPK